MFLHGDVISPLILRYYHITLKILGHVQITYRLRLFVHIVLLHQA
jgi:hypothetical protein